MSVEGDALVAALEAALTTALGPGVRVFGLARLSGGASRETWELTAERPGHAAHELILQRERPGGMRSATGIGIEATLLRAAARAGVAVAGLVAAQGDPGLDGIDVGGPWLVSERVAGETIARRILRDDAYAVARSRLAAQCGAELAAIHRIPLNQVPGLVLDDPVEQHRVLLDQLGQPHPALELGLRWLEANRPEPVDPAVVHGDFRNGNLVVGPDGLRAVLDWELAHQGDPVEDLAWLCVRAWRFGSPLPVGGFGERADLLAAYEAAGGTRVEPDRLHWWEVMGTLRWGVICILQTTSHLLGLSRSVELAAVGRRVCETEHDLLALLPAARPATAAAATAEPEAPAQAQTGPHDVPTIAGLVTAVREFLDDDVSAATDGRVRFHARVAGNVLGTVERELILGPEQARAHTVRLSSLGLADDRSLASAIRSGSLDHRSDEVQAVVAASVADKLAVANPTYGTDRT